MLRCIRHMLVCERSHKEVAVVVVGLHPEVNALVISGFFRGFDQVFREKLLLLVEVVTCALPSVNTMHGGVGGRLRGIYHVNEHLQRALPLLHKFCSIVLLPLLLLVLSKVSLKRLLTPWTVDGVGNWREGRDRFIHSGVLQELRFLC
jgi:hypothetical protein